ncbi:Fur family transcriptional regulator [Leadbettera azotonutricia]|nr:transcriptional repressor [Leadbettera azotonutricia]
MIPIMNKANQKTIRRNTSQRDLVLDAVCKGNHLSAREIFELVSAKKRMSFGTVYRNLQILEEEGEIVAIKTDPELLHYDRRLERHHHLHCRKCGKVFDVFVPYRPEFDIEAAQESGFIIDSHAITFEGLCGVCQNIR